MQKRALKTCFLACLLTALLLPFTAVEGKTGTSGFPLNPGTKWKYINQDGSTDTLSIVRNYFFGSIPLCEVAFNSQEPFYLIPSEDGIFKLSFDPARKTSLQDREMTLLFKSPLAIGQSWQSPWTDPPLTFTVLAAEEVVVPAGSFPEALKIGYRVVSSPIYEGYIWLVSGTGIVAQEQSGYRSELTSYTRSALLAPLPTSLTTEEIEKSLNIATISPPVQPEQPVEKSWLASHIPHVMVSSLLILGCGVFLVILSRTRRDIDLEESEDVQEGELILAQAMVKEDMLEDASRILQRLAEKHPEWPDIAALLGSAYYRLGKVDEACLEFKRAITLNPNMVSARLELAKIYLELNDPSNALEEVEPVILANPDFADAIYLKGEVYMALGEIDAAIETFRSALSLNPDFANARKALEEALSSN